MNILWLCLVVVVLPIVVGNCGRDIFVVVALVVVVWLWKIFICGCGFGCGIVGLWARCILVVVSGRGHGRSCCRSFSRGDIGCGRTLDG